MAYNKSYHRFFEGYVEKKEYDPVTGRSYIKRTYAGDYYEHCLDRDSLKKVETGYALTLAAGATVIILQGTDPSATGKLAAFPILLEVIAAAWLAFYLVCYIRAGQKLIKRQFRDREMLISLPMAMAGGMILTAAAEIVFLIRSGVFLWRTAACILLSVLAAYLFYRMHRTEKNMEYTKIISSQKVDRDSYDITYRESED